MNAAFHLRSLAPYSIRHASGTCRSCALVPGIGRPRAFVPDTRLVILAAWTCLETASCNAIFPTAIPSRSADALLLPRFIPRNSTRLVLLTGLCSEAADLARGLSRLFASSCHGEGAASAEWLEHAHLSPRETSRTFAISGYTGPWPALPAASNSSERVSAVFLPRAKFPVRARLDWSIENRFIENRRHVHFATDRAVDLTSWAESGSTKSMFQASATSVNRCNHAA